MIDGRSASRLFDCRLVAVGLALALVLLAGGLDALLGPAAPVDVSCPAAEAWAAGESGLWMECTATVSRLLADDLRGSRHQRFVVELAGGHTLLLSHNIDLAPRIEDLSVGDRIRFRGEFEHNARGGVVHWTHHDPRGRRTGGWVEHHGRRYR